MSRRELDVSHLPDHAFGHRSLTGWGLGLMMCIEGSVFVMAMVSYVYLRGLAREWPLGALPPDLAPGIANLLVFLASLWPAHVAKRKAEEHDLPGCRRWLLITAAFAAVTVALRAVELAGVNVRWDSNAYGSLVWVLIGMHTIHLVTDFGDSFVLAALLFVGPVRGKQFVDASDNSTYWYFVVASWVPLFAILYLVPRL